LILIFIIEPLAVVRTSCTIVRVIEPQGLGGCFA
jgi:hypothetical protein